MAEFKHLAVLLNLNEKDSALAKAFREADLNNDQMVNYEGKIFIILLSLALNIYMIILMMKNS